MIAAAPPLEIRKSMFSGSNQLAGYPLIRLRATSVTSTQLGSMKSLEPLRGTLLLSTFVPDQRSALDKVAVVLASP